MLNVFDVFHNSTVSLLNFTDAAVLPSIIFVMHGSTKQNTIIGSTTISHSTDAVLHKRAIEKTLFFTISIIHQMDGDGESR
jgi:hypothetical protein